MTYCLGGACIETVKSVGNKTSCFLVGVTAWRDFGILFYFLGHHVRQMLKSFLEGFGGGERWVVFTESGLVDIYG